MIWFRADQTLWLKSQFEQVWDGLNILTWFKADQMLWFLRLIRVQVIWPNILTWFKADQMLWFSRLIRAQVIWPHKKSLTEQRAYCDLATQTNENNVNSSCYSDVCCRRQIRIIMCCTEMLGLVCDQNKCNMRRSLMV